MLKILTFYQILNILINQTLAKPNPETAVNLAPRPFGNLENLSPPAAPVANKVFIPPDIKYWAYGKVNTTVVDAGGLPWYCYTYR